MKYSQRPLPPDSPWHSVHITSASVFRGVFARDGVGKINVEHFPGVIARFAGLKSTLRVFGESLDALMDSQSSTLMIFGESLCVVMGLSQR